MSENLKTNISEAMKMSDEFAGVDMKGIFEEDDLPLRRLALKSENHSRRNTVEPVSKSEPAPSPEPITSIETPRLQDLPIRRAAMRLEEAAPVLPFGGEDPTAAEQYRLLRTRVLHHPAQPRSIVVTSAGPSEGKSVSSVNLAGALSLKSQSGILLVDGDLRRSSIHKLLGLPASPGLSEVLAGKTAPEDAIVQTEQFPNLYVLCAGQLEDYNPGELLDSARMKNLVAQMTALFKIVVIDSPPINTVTDYELIESLCEGIIMVVRPDYTKRQRCFDALTRIPKEKLIGVLLNCVEPSAFSRSEQYTY